MYRDEIGRNDLTTFKQMIKEEIKDEILKEIWASYYNKQSFGLHEETNHRQPFYEGYQQTTFHPSVDGIINTQGYKILPNQITENPNILSNSKWSNSSIKEHRNEILYGMGTVAVLGMLMPHFRRKIGTILGRTASEGMEILERTRSLIAKAKEDMEDLIAEVSFTDSAGKQRR